MSKLILFTTPRSPPARATVFLAQYLDLDVDIKNLDFTKREQHSEEYLKLNPAHQVPTLIDGDFVLTESRAILAYLVSSRKPGSDLCPTDPKLKARVDQRMCYDHVLFTKNSAVCRPIIYEGAKSVPQQARDGIRDTLSVIDKNLEGSKWIAGENLTIADFSAVTIVTTIAECGYDLDKHVNLKSWYEQCKALKGFEDNRKGAKIVADTLKNAIEGPIY